MLKVAYIRNVYHLRREFVRPETSHVFFPKSIESTLMAKSIKSKKGFVLL